MGLSTKGVCLDRSSVTSLVWIRKFAHFIELLRQVREGRLAMFSCNVKLHYVLPFNVPQFLKSKVFDQCVLPVLNYGTEMWPLTMSFIQKVKVAQRVIERVLRVSVQDHVRNDFD